MNRCAYRLSEKLKIIWVMHLYFSNNAQFGYIKLSLFNFAGAKRTVPTLLKTCWHVLLTVWWLQSRTMRMYQRASFVDGFLVVSILSSKSPLLQFVHQDGLVMQCFFPLCSLNRYLDCCPRKCNKHPKERRDQTAACILPKSSANTFSVASARTSDKLIAFPLNERYNTSSHFLLHLNLLTPFFLLLLRSPSFASSIFSPFFQTLPIESWGETAGNHSQDRRKA